MSRRQHLFLWGFAMKGSARWVSLLGYGVVLCLMAVGLHGARGELSLRLPFLAGAMFSLVNPLHLPFWLGWIAVLRQRRILRGKDGGIFPAAVGAGTALAFLAYGFVGSFFVRWLGMYRGALNWAVALSLIVAGLGYMRTLIRRLRLRSWKRVR